MRDRLAVPQSDLCLMLRAHAEQGWLSREVLPVLLQLEAPGALPADQLPAALAYLEVAWMKAQLLAWESDSTRARLQGDPAVDPVLGGDACRYHGAVRSARSLLADRVSVLLTRDSQGPDQKPSWQAPPRARGLSASPVRPA